MQHKAKFTRKKKKKQLNDSRLGLEKKFQGKVNTQISKTNSVICGVSS